MRVAPRTRIVRRRAGHAGRASDAAPAKLRENRIAEGFFARRHDHEKPRGTRSVHAGSIERPRQVAEIDGEPRSRPRFAEAIEQAVVPTSRTHRLAGTVRKHLEE